MTLRISIDDTGVGRRLGLHGRLTAAEANELARQAEVGRRPLILDLRDLLSADTDGLALLRSLRDGGAELSWMSPYLSLLLEAEDGTDVR